MARAKRHYLPGYAWHITHRCHQREFLLKFSRDRKRWLHWLFEAKKRYGLCILNYMVTSNHIHLLVFDCGEREVIPKSMQLTAGRTAQEYNDRKMRKGAFWDDRYHATAVETDDHLIQCIVYMDMNMVRAGVVGHPSEWESCGYQEIQAPCQRYGLIDHKSLMELLHLPSLDLLQNSHRAWVQQRIEKESGSVRDSRWTECIAVGSRNFVEGAGQELGIRARGRKVVDMEDGCVLRELQSPYSGHSEGKNSALSSHNLLFWDIYPGSSDG